MRVAAKFLFMGSCLGDGHDASSMEAFRLKE